MELKILEEQSKRIKDLNENKGQCKKGNDMMGYSQGMGYRVQDFRTPASLITFRFKGILHDGIISIQQEVN